MSLQELFTVQKQVAVARNELKNIREQMKALQKLQHKYVKEIQGNLKKFIDSQGVLSSKENPNKQDQKNAAEPDKKWEVKPIGIIHSAFKYKNATPRQPSICSLTTATLELNKEYFTNPDHALDGLLDFSHIWLIFLFHKNDKQSYCKGKVAPPRLDGKRIGVFSTRSPHRPNPIGLSLARLIKIEGNLLYLSGIDAVDETPVLDIKPYIPAYDQPNFNHKFANNLQEPAGEKFVSRNHIDDSETDQRQSSHDQIEAANYVTLDVDSSKTLQTKVAELKSADNNIDVAVPNWIDSPPVKQLDVYWTTRAKRNFCATVGQDATIELDKFCEESGTFKTITSILKEDPRSVYRRHHCKDQLYYLIFDFLHLTCWFDDSNCSVEVVKVGTLKNNENKHD